jgi:hypothetical protein
MAQKSRPGEKAANPIEDKPNSTGYPVRIVLTPNAEAYIDQLACDLITGKVELHQLSGALLQFHTFAFNLGRQSRQAEIDRLNHELDRAYVAKWNPIRIDPNRPSFAELERRRGNAERADLIEADLANMLGGDRS